MGKYLTCKLCGQTSKDDYDCDCYEIDSLAVLKLRKGCKILKTYVESMQNQYENYVTFIYEKLENEDGEIIYTVFDGRYFSKITEDEYLEGDSDDEDLNEAKDEDDSNEEREERLEQNWWRNTYDQMAEKQIGNVSEEIFLQACSCGSLKMVKYQVEKNPDFLKSPKCIVRADVHEHTEIVQYLTEKGAVYVKDAEIPPGFERLFAPGNF